MSRGRKRIPHWIYFLLNEGKIVYIGVTSDLKSRMMGHRKKRHDAVRAIKLKHKEMAMHYERRFILLFKPIFNSPVKTWDQFKTAMSFYVSNAERELIENMANEANCNMSTFIRSKIFS